MNVLVPQTRRRHRRASGLNFYSSVLSALAALTALACLALPASGAVAVKPPMGWNSYDAFNFSVTETEFKAVVDTMAKKYLSYGWEYAVVDWSWSFPGMSSSGTPNQGWTATGGVTTHIKIDAYGRPQPDTVRHPSSVGGLGFKALADYTHAHGMKFGIHLMRGIYREAYWVNTPVLGTSYHARDIADTTSKCPWLDHTFGLNMNHPGAQAYLNSLFAMFADWGVDFIKIDDMVANRVTPHVYHDAELLGYRKAIDSSGREMVFSSSPGSTPIGSAALIKPVLNQWRMADDLWDNWTNLNAMFDLAKQWQPHVGPGHFPDADMIPIGRLSKRGPNGSTRFSSLTRTQQYTLMTLWSIFRSPLLWGGNPAENRLLEDSLMTNAAVIGVNQNGSNPRSIGSVTNTPVWTSDSPDPLVKYFTLFNRNTSTTSVSARLDSMGAVSGTVTNLWTGEVLGATTTTFSASLPAYGSGLYKLEITQTSALRPHAGPRAPTAVPGEISDGAFYELRGRRLPVDGESGKPAKTATGAYLRKEDGKR